ncbi:AI-2E family transporter [Candidatus Woesearchaeota archaeon]|nr:AI-2E family transporter [Candidatus Woesearchaeota archaeon]
MGEVTIDKRHLFHYVLIGILLSLIYLTFLLLKPFLTYLIMGLILSYLFHPLYKRLAKKTGREWISSIIMLLLILCIIVIPSFFIISGLVTQTSAAYDTFSTLLSSSQLHELITNLGMDVTGTVQGVATQARDYVLSAAPNIIGGVANMLIGLFIMFFLMYYAFIDGERWLVKLERGLPLEPKVKKQLFNKLGDLTGAVMYGQVLSAIIQGSLGGLLFFAFGIDNYLFWGALMILLSFIPVLGTPLVWVPIGITELLQHNYISGIGILLLGATVIMNIDNFIKPYLIGSKAKISPLLILLGVLGGLKLFGFIGLFLGPLVLALLHTVMDLLNETPRKT